MTLPFVDSHSVTSAARPTAVWDELRRTTERMSSRPGFHLSRVEEPRRVELQGRHPFARYELAFAVEPAAEGSRLVAETHAAFPGAAGHLYRMLVIGSGAHAIVVKRMLRRVVRRAATR